MAAGRMSASYRVAVLPGDGIRPEVISEAQATLELAAKLGGFGVEVETFQSGGAHHVATGQPMAPDVPARLVEFDAILAGPFGDPRVPDSVILWGTILELRQRFDQYVNLRPARTLPGVPGALRAPSSEAFDVVVVRENTEGEYSGAGGRVHRGSGGEVAVLSVALMVEFLGQPATAVAIERAVDASTGQAETRTPDIGGTADTRAAGEAIRRALERELSGTEIG